MGDDRPCNMKMINIVLIKTFDGMVQELKEVINVPQLKKYLISDGVLKALDLEISGRDDVLKMLRGSIVVMKGVRRNNLYYLKDITVTEQMTTSIVSDDD